MKIPLAYNLRSARQRWTSSLVAVLGIAGTVGVFVAMLALARGFKATLVSSGLPQNAIVQQSGADTVMTNALLIDAVRIVEDQPQIGRHGSRASRAMAAQTLSQAGVPFTFSHDEPVTPQPWILPLVDAGVNRTAASGTVVGRLVAGAALADPLWDTSTWLSEHSVPGQILHALMGYVARPSGMRVVFFLSVASALGVLMKRFDRVPPGLAPVSLVRRPRERSANRRRRNSNP